MTTELPILTLLSTHNGGESQGNLFHRKTFLHLCQVIRSLLTTKSWSRTLSSLTAPNTATSTEGVQCSCFSHGMAQERPQLPLARSKLCLSLPTIKTLINLKPEHPEPLLMNLQLPFQANLHLLIKQNSVHNNGKPWQDHLPPFPSVVKITISQAPYNRQAQPRGSHKYPRRVHRQFSTMR